ncbi:MAG: PcfJ domain-containing protein, partial [Clostridia bacterium]
HCVGKMNYDQKFIREETLIFFIRNKDNIETPFVTVEYSLKSRKVLQCYGDNDTKPDDTVATFVNKLWLPYANKQVKKLQKVA